MPRALRVPSAITAGALALLLATVAATPASASVPQTYTAGNWHDLVTVLGLASGGDTVQLAGDIDVPSGSNVDLTGKSIVLDLAGFALTIESPAATDAAVEVPDGSELTIVDSSDAGTGHLTATGGPGGAGIGSGTGDDAGRITIAGGTVTALGGGGSAGIGGGYYGSGDTTTITGGTVIANGGTQGAGIGGGGYRDGRTTTISGGDVTATGGDGGAGIGGGYYGDQGSTTISGGDVTATGGDSGAGIGGGRYGDGGSTTISGGAVHVTSGFNNTGTGAAGIGGGKWGLGGTVTVSGPESTDGLPTHGGGDVSNRSSVVYDDPTEGVSATGTANEGDPAVFELVFMYTVTFDADGGSPEPTGQTVNDGSTATEPSPAPTGNGFTFDFWSADGASEWDFNTPITEPTTLIALWTIETYDVTFDVAGATTVVPVTFGDTVAPGDIPTDTGTGARIAGWESDPAGLAVTDPITGPVTFTASLEYLVIYDSRPDLPGNAGDWVEAGGYLTNWYAYKPGATLIGWVEEGTTEVVQDLGPITAPTSYNAVYEYIEYTPDEGELAADPAGCIIAPESAYPGDEIEVAICPGLETDVDLWLFSTPAMLAKYVLVDYETGAIATVTIPADATPGTHKIAAWDVAGYGPVGWTEIEILADPAVVSEPELAATGAESTWLIAVAAALGALGVLFLTRRRV